MRKKILKGELDFPGTKLMSMYPDSEKDIERFWKAIWSNYLNGNETNALVWYDLLGAKIYNDVVRRLSHHGWVVSISLPGRRWASVEMCTEKLLEFVTVEELDRVRANRKYDKYMLDHEESTKYKDVRQNGETRKTGLERRGFMAAGNTEFGFDMEALSEFKDEVIKNTVKSMLKIRKDYPDLEKCAFSFDEVSKGIYEWHEDNPNLIFTTGDSISDSRGRAISKCLKRVANPIGYKDFRAALVVTYD